MESIGAIQGPLTPATIEATKADLTRLACRTIRTLDAELRHRMDIYRASGDAELAVQGYEWVKEMGETPDLVTVLAICAGAVGKRLHGAEVVISEELYRHMIEQPGLPVWTHRNPHGGVFYVAKAWAVEEATGISLPAIVSGIVGEVLRYVH